MAFPEGSSSAPNEVQQPQGAPEASTGTSSQPAGPSQSEAGGPIRVSPSSPSSPTPSWFEGAVNYYQSCFGDDQALPDAEGQPIGPHAPSIEYLEKKNPSVLRGCQRVAVRSDFFTTILEDLRLLDA